MNMLVSMCPERLLFPRILVDMPPNIIFTYREKKIFSEVKLVSNIRLTHIFGLFFF